MKKLSRKILSVLLVIAMLVPTGALMVNTSAAENNSVGIPGYIQNTSGEKAKGTCTDTISWTLYNDGELVVVGTGKMPDWSYAEVVPWNCYWASIEKVVIGNGITAVGCSAFDGCKKMISVTIPFSVKKIVGFAFFICDSLQKVYYTGTKNQWNLINVGMCNTDLTNAELICEWEFEGDFSGEHFPEGFDEKDCFWGFPNSAKNIDIEFFKKYYGALIGWYLYNIAGDTPGSKGVCYGMAAAAAVFNSGYVSSKSIYSDIIGDYVDVLCFASQSDTITSMNITINDLIIYSQVSRYSYDSNRAIDANKKDSNIYDNLINAVTDYVNGNGMPVVISMTGHALLACGLGENDSSKIEIKVFDPNLCTAIKTFTIYKNQNGEYTGWEYGIYNYDNSQLSYICPSSDLYSTLFKRNIARITEQEVSHNLLLIEGDYEQLSDETNMCELYVEGDSNIVNNKKDVAYWMNEETKTILLTSKSEKTKVIFANEKSAFEIIMPYDSIAEIKVDNGDYDIAKLSNCNSDDITLTFRTVDLNENILSTTLTGTANSDEVTATETEDGIQVTGLNNITVTYETADGTAETTAKVDDGSTVNIKVNDDNNTVETDWQCKHPDENHDGICDTCSEDFTKSCSCSCHSNAFMQFIHKILCFLYRIFGMEQYRYCGCGKAHW